ncbi:MAG: hypothetical protein IVW52_10535 [Acidimicrobiales bacterium]|nr:hypothetical protein [Acidimicrobiales bacterium]
MLRLHSANGDRLPWQFPQPVRGITDDFLRLREVLMPYTYTLASQAHNGGLPVAQPSGESEFQRSPQAVTPPPYRSTVMSDRRFPGGVVSTDPSATVAQRPRGNTQRDQRWNWDAT